MTDGDRPTGDRPTDDDGMTDGDRPTDAAAASDPSDAPDPAAALDGGDASLLALVDRLAIMLDRSDLSELEVEAGGTALVLRKPAPVLAGASGAPASAAPSGQASGAPGAPGSAAVASAAGGSAAPSDAPARPSVRAPLTGIYYASPAPGSAPYVRVGGEVAVGQVIGLIEAMKLFNEIKSDLAGRVVRVVAESGQLVKAKQPLIEVDPL